MQKVLLHFWPARENMVPLVARCEGGNEYISPELSEAGPGTEP